MSSGGAPVWRRTAGALPAAAASAACLFTVAGSTVAQLTKIGIAVPGSVALTGTLRGRQEMR